MDSLKRDDLRTLLETQNERCISIFMPTVRTGDQIQQNPIRFKNLLRTAEERLTKLGLRRQDAADFLQPAADLLDDPDFWRHQSDGLAVFLTDGMLRTFSLPRTFDELVVVTNRFHLKRLIPLLNNDGRFYILALSQNEARLLEATKSGARRVEAEEMPTTLADALKLEESQGFGRLSAASEGGSDNGPANDERVKQRLLRYFQQVDRGISDMLKERDAPLVLAGVEYLLPIYREASSYRYILEDVITGNPDNMNSKELHQRAWELVEPVFERELEEQIERFRELEGRGAVEGSSDLKSILEAAHLGRVGTLFVASGVRHWGTFDPNTLTLHTHSEQQPDGQDLLDLAAIQTYLTGGRVYALPPEAMPKQNQPIAAVFRY
jgi:hypothetical protein